MERKQPMDLEKLEKKLNNLITQHNIGLCHSMDVNRYLEGLYSLGCSVDLIKGGRFNYVTSAKVYISDDNLK